MNMLVLLEHLNFKIPFDGGERVVQDFFVTRLGCPECPTGRLRVTAPVKGPLKEGTAKQMHVNMGLSQIHFEWCTGDGRVYETPQRLQGAVTLAVRDLRRLKANLTGMNFVEDSEGSVIVTDPFGLTTWVCVQASDELEKTVSQFGQVRAGGVGNVLAITRVDYDCQAGVSGSIAEFYSKAFNAQVIKHRTGHAIATRFEQFISFNETLTAPPPNAYDLNPTLFGIHMCFYIDRFEAHSKQLQQLFWVNPDYKIPPINDNVTTVEGAVEKKQFRLKKVGQHYVEEHEIRAMDHPLSPLKNMPASLSSKL